MTADESTSRLPHRWLSLRRQRHDPLSAWTLVALGALVGAAALAVVGVPSVDIHGPLHYLGVMDPLCGGTRSWYLTTRMELGEAVRYNPAGPVLLAVTAMIVVRGAVGWLSGFWLMVKVPRRLWISVAVVALVVLEVNQQLHADLLMQPWGGS